jgi:hypothetical protein
LRREAVSRSEAREESAVAFSDPEGRRQVSDLASASADARRWCASSGSPPPPERRGAALSSMDRCRKSST